ncbi:MAG: LptF/LptG family permease [candidate division WOR-3 bacterium]
MKRIDFYILYEFLRVFAVIIIGVVVLYIIVNFFENIDKFINPQRGFKFFSIMKYYAYQLPYLFVLMSPVALMLSCFFAIGDLSRRFEIIAIKSIGMSMKRTFLTIYIFSIIIALITLYLYLDIVGSWMKKSEWIKAVEIENKKIPKERTFALNLTFVSGNKVYFFNEISALTSSARGIVIIELEKEQKVKKRIDASSGKYEDNIWTLYEVKERKFNSDNVEVNFYKEKKYKEIEESPFEFLTEIKELQQMNFRELKNRIEKLKRAGFEINAELTELYTRISFPFMNIITIILSLPIAVAIRGKGKAWGFGIAVLFVFIYWGLSEAFRTLGIVGKLEPILCAWIPNMFFFFIGIFGWFKIEN